MLVPPHNTRSPVILVWHGCTLRYGNQARGNPIQNAKPCENSLTKLARALVVLVVHFRQASLLPTYGRGYSTGLMANHRELTLHGKRASGSPNNCLCHMRRGWSITKLGGTCPLVILRDPSISRR